MGNNRVTAVTSDQIAIIMDSAIESIARQGIENVVKDERDIAPDVHKQIEQRQAARAEKLSTLNT
jgi:hypothetical protein